MPGKSTTDGKQDSDGSRKPTRVQVVKGLDFSTISFEHSIPMEMGHFDLHQGVDYLLMNVNDYRQRPHIPTIREELDYRTHYEPAEVARMLYDIAVSSGNLVEDPFEALNLPYPYEINGLELLEMDSYRKGATKGDFRRTINSILDSNSPVTEERKSLVEMLMLQVLKGAASMGDAAQRLEHLCTAYKLETPTQGVEYGDPKVEGIGAAMLKGIAGLQTVWEVGFFPTNEDFGAKYRALNPLKEPAVPPIIQGWTNYFAQVKEEYDKLVAVPKEQVA